VRNNFDIDAYVQYGKKVAAAVIELSKTDGASNAAVPYTPLGEGYWEPTAPAYAAAAVPGWANNRTILPGSTNNTTPAAPLVFSKEAGSPFYNMVKELYDISQTLTAEQTATALYYRDNPGFGGGHYLSIIKQVLEQENPQLDFTALVFTKASIAIVDAGIGCWKAKYQYNQERPITYIRDVLGYPNWNALFGTPNFPDFPSGHSTIAGSFTEILASLFGSHYSFTNHTYDYLGMAPRSFNSFDELAKEIGDSRVYAGIHYTYSCVAGRKQGEKIGQNILNKLKFKK